MTKAEYKWRSRRSLGTNSNRKIHCLCFEDAPTAFDHTVLCPLPGLKGRFMWALDVTRMQEFCNEDSLIKVPTWDVQEQRNAPQNRVDSRSASVSSSSDLTFLEYIEGKNGLDVEPAINSKREREPLPVFTCEPPRKFPRLEMPLTLEALKARLLNPVIVKIVPVMATEVKFDADVAIAAIDMDDPVVRESDCDLSVTSLAREISRSVSAVASASCGDSHAGADEEPHEDDMEVVSETPSAQPQQQAPCDKPTAHLPLEEADNPPVTTSTAIEEPVQATREVRKIALPAPRLIEDRIATAEEMALSWTLPLHGTSGLRHPMVLVLVPDTSQVWVGELMSGLPNGEVMAYSYNIQHQRQRNKPGKQPLLPLEEAAFVPGWYRPSSSSQIEYLRSSRPSKDYAPYWLKIDPVQIVAHGFSLLNGGYLPARIVRMLQAGIDNGRWILPRK